MQKIEQVTGRVVPLPLDDIDTDRIIPARYLRCVTFDGLGEHSFEDDRKQDPNHPFDDARFQGASILLAGSNFGCGSSREHAPQALIRWGIKALIAESFAEIFFGNCTALGIPAVTAKGSDIEALEKLVEADPSVEIKVDLENKQVTCGSYQCPLEMLDSARDALLSGQWDFMGLLLANTDQIKQTAQQIPYLNQFAIV